MANGNPWDLSNIILSDQRGANMARGIESVGQSGADAIQTYKQNKIMVANATAKFEGSLQANPELQQVLTSEKAPPDVAKVYQKLQKDGTLNVRDAAYLAQYADTYSEQKDKLQAQQLRQAQIDALNTELAQKKTNAAALSGALTAGDASGYMSAPGQPPAPPGVNASDALRYLRPNGAPAPAAPPMQGPPPTAMDADQVLAAYTKRGGQLTPELGNLLSHFDATQARRDAATAKGTGPLKVVKIRSADAQGNPIEVTVDANSGQEIGRGPMPRLYPSPEEKARETSLTEEAKKNVEDSHKLLGDISDTAETSRVRAGSIGRIMNLYDHGATSGFSQPTLTAMKSAFQRVGLGSTNLANQQQLEKEMNLLVLESGRELMKGGGSVSNYERSAIEAASANPKLTPEANRQILNVLKAVADRNVALDKKRIDLDEQGVPSTEIARELRRLRDSMPLGVESIGASPAEGVLSKYGIK